MPLVWRNTTYSELTGSPVEQIAPNQGRANRVIRVPWSARVQAVKDFVGSNTRQGNSIVRLSPHQHPDYAGLWCQGASIEPIGTRGVSATGVADYEWAKINLTYTTLTFALIDNAGPTSLDEGANVAAGTHLWVTPTFKPANRLLVLNKGMMRVVNDGDASLRKPIPEGLPIMRPGRMLNYVWHWIPFDSLPKSRWLEAQGKINLNAFDGYPAGSLLLEEIDYTMEQHPIYGRICTVSYGMKADLYIDPISLSILGWNYHLDVFTDTTDSNRKKLKMFLVSSDGTSNANATRKFQTYDFANLFRPT